MRIIGLSGYARTGKDTVAQILVENHGFERVAFADALRELLQQVDPIVDVTYEGFGEYGVYRLSDALTYYKGWEGAKDGEPGVRRIMQAHGVAFRKMQPGGSYVIPDMRFPNELVAVRQHGGLTVRVERPGYGPVNGHISETALDRGVFDYYLSNNGPTADTLIAKVGGLLGVMDWRWERLRG